MKPFLKSIAQAYLDHYDDLSEFCFLFPNKRSGTFFLKYLREESKQRTIISPQITDITEFVTRLSGRVVAPRIEQLFILYNSYLEILNSKRSDDKELSIDFESFRNWGEMVLSDFNLIDQYLVDPNEIFKNVKDYREIATDFLTEEQKEVMAEYFGHYEPEDTSRFWKNFEDVDNLSPLKIKFLNLWQVLEPLYEIYNSNLEKKGYASPGSIYRLAYDYLKAESQELWFKKIVIIGFNALSASERGVFNILKNRECYFKGEDFADFIWDATGPVLTEKGNSASKFVLSNMHHYPMPEWINDYISESDASEFPEIRIISAPSNSSQVKIVGQLLKDFKDRNGGDSVKEAEVVLVLPDEQLLSTALYSIPEEIGEINLTMGYSFRLTSMASYMSLLRRVYADMRITASDKTFYNKDLKLLLSHPFSFILYGSEGIEKLNDYINRYHKINISLSEISNFIKEAAVTLNFPSKTSDDVLVFDYLFSHLQLLHDKIHSQRERGGSSLELNHLELYRDYLHILHNSVEEYEIKLSPLGVFTLADRLISSEKISFEGEPLAGLQVMGTLETRSLDFKEVYIVSMNEGKMPGRSRTKTFIPETLRKAYALPPSFYSEEIFAYYFFRLISRAQKVTLIYDSRNSNGARSGESRYLLQIKHFAEAAKLNIENWNFRLQGKETTDASIIKSDEIFRMLDDYMTDDEGKRKNFSASSLNTYRECEVKFFYRHMLNLDPDPAPGETIDVITIGNILHKIMMELYLPSSLQKRLLDNPVTINKNIIENLINDPDYIYNSVKRKVNQYHFHLDKENLDQSLSGSAEIIARQITWQIIEILKHDLTLAPFELLGCEIDHSMKVSLKSGRSVNFKFAIDRLDRIKTENGPRLRIVDYKTGGRKREAKTFEEVFSGDYQAEQVFQLFTYAWLFGYLTENEDKNVITEIYFVPDFIQGRKGYPVVDGKEVEDFDEYRENFSEGMDKMLENVFISAQFKETKNASQCIICPFNRICGK